jgi:hypothetical protein
MGFFPEAGRPCLLLEASVLLIFPCAGGGDLLAVIFARRMKNSSLDCAPLGVAAFVTLR